MTLALHHLRQGQGPPLLLLHGIGMSHAAWHPVLDRVAQAHDVLAVDLPGFGRSPALRGGASLGDLADEVAEALDAVGWDAPHVAGSSLGGAIALELAHRGRARSVVAFSPGGFQSERDDVFIRAALWSLRAGALAAAPFAPLLARSAWFRRLALAFVSADGARVEPRWAVDAIRAMADASAFGSVVDAFDAREMQQRIAAPIDVPIRIVWGAKDRLLWPRLADRAEQLIPSADVLRVSGLGHVPTADDPTRVAELILSWTAPADAEAAAAPA